MKRYKSKFESIEIPLEKGDSFRYGKFKNKTAVYDSSYINDKGDLIIKTDDGKEIGASKIRLIQEDTGNINLYVNSSLDYFEGIKNIDGKYIVWGRSTILKGEIKTRIQNWIYKNLHKNQNFFFRSTDNKDEIDLVRNYPNLKSKNQGQNFTEKGLSVSEHSGYKDFFGYKYIYVVTGKIIDYGSDGEPLLSNVKVLSKMNQISQWIKKLEQLEKLNLRKLGLTTEEYDKIKNYDINFIDYTDVVLKESLFKEEHFSPFKAWYFPDKDEFIKFPTNKDYREYVDNYVSAMKDGAVRIHAFDSQVEVETKNNPDSRLYSKVLNTLAKKIHNFKHVVNHIDWFASGDKQVFNLQEEEFHLSLTPTSNGKFGIWDYIGKHRVYKKGTSSPIYFDNEKDAKEYAVKYMNKKYGKNDYKFEENENPLYPFMNRESYDLYYTYEKQWKKTSSWDSFVKENKDIFNKETLKIKNDLKKIQDPKRKQKKFEYEMFQLKIQFTSIWNILKNNKLKESNLFEYKRFELIKNKYSNSVFTEDLHLSDFTRHAGVSSFTKKFMKDRQRLKGAGNISAKIKGIRVNRKKDYITLIFEAVPTYTKTAKAVSTPSMEINKTVRKYTQMVQIQDFFKLAETKPGYVESELTFKEVKEILQVASIKVFCNCPSFHWQGDNYIASMFDASIFPTNIPPKHWKAYHNDDNFACKHLDILFTSGLNIYLNNMTSSINKYLKQNKK